MTELQTPAELTPEYLDQLAKQADVSPEMQAVIDTTIEVVQWVQSLVIDTLVYKRGSEDEPTDIPIPTVPDGKLAAYIAVRLAAKSAQPDVLGQ